jgi:hypothetical protein
VRTRRGRRDEMQPSRFVQDLASSNAREFAQTIAMHDSTPNVMSIRARKRPPRCGGHSNGDERAVRVT